MRRVFEYLWPWGGTPEDAPPPPTPTPTPTPTPQDPSEPAVESPLPPSEPGPSSAPPPQPVPPAPSVAATHTAFPPLHLVYEPVCFELAHTWRARLHPPITDTDAADTHTQYAGAAMVATTTRTALRHVLLADIAAAVSMHADRFVAQLLAYVADTNPILVLSRRNNVIVRKLLTVAASRGIQRAINVLIEEHYVGPEMARLKELENTRPKEDIDEWTVLHGFRRGSLPLLLRAWLLAQTACCRCAHTEQAVANTTVPVEWNPWKVPPSARDVALIPASKRRAGVALATSISQLCRHHPSMDHFHPATPRRDVASGVDEATQMRFYPHTEQAPLDPPLPGSLDAVERSVFQTASMRGEMSLEMLQHILARIVPEAVERYAMTVLGRLEAHTRATIAREETRQNELLAAGKLGVEMRTMRIALADLVFLADASITLDMLYGDGAPIASDAAPVRTGMRTTSEWVVGNPMVAEVDALREIVRRIEMADRADDGGGDSGHVVFMDRLDNGEGYRVVTGVIPELQGVWEQSDEYSGAGNISYSGLLSDM